MILARRLATFSLVSLVLLVLASCDSSSRNGTSASNDATGAREEVSSAAVDEAYDVDTKAVGLPHTEQYNKIQNTADLLSQLSYTDQNAVSGFYEKYGDKALEFSTQQQLKWMIDQGYPMPDDIIGAMKMTDVELLQAFEAGDAKAGFFYLDRRIDQVRSLKDTGNSVSPEARMELGSLARKLLSTGSPFSGYVAAHYQAVVEEDLNASLASYAWAVWLGDTRAAELMAQIEGRRGSSLSSSATTFNFLSLLQSVRATNPELLRWNEKNPFPASTGPSG